MVRRGAPQIELNMGVIMGAGRPAPGGVDQVDRAHLARIHASREINGLARSVARRSRTAEAKPLTLRRFFARAALLENHRAIEPRCIFARPTPYPGFLVSTSPRPPFDVLYRPLRVFCCRAPNWKYAPSGRGSV